MPKLETEERWLDLYEPLVLACEELGPLVKHMRKEGLSERGITDGLITALGMLYLENRDPDQICKLAHGQLTAILDNPELLHTPMFDSLRDLVRDAPAPEG